MTTARDRLDGMYLLRCDKCRQTFIGYKGDQICMVCQADMGPPTMAEWKSFADATLQGWQRDAARLDYLDTLPQKHGWQGWQVLPDGLVMSNVGGTIRDAIDRAMKEAAD